jgi:hypothetical protein
LVRIIAFNIIFNSIKYFSTNPVALTYSISSLRGADKVRVGWWVLVRLLILDYKAEVDVRLPESQQYLK